MTHKNLVVCVGEHAEMEGVHVGVQATPDSNGEFLYHSAYTLRWCINIL